MDELPQSNLRFDSSLLEGAFWHCAFLLFPLSHGLRRASSPSGEPFGAPYKLKPDASILEGGGCECNEQTEGVKISSQLFACLNPSVTACAVPAPPQAVEPFSTVQAHCTVPYPSRSDRFNGVTGGAGVPKGRNRNLPWPPCKKVIRKLAVLFYSLRLLVSLAATSLDGEAFGCDTICQDIRVNAQVGTRSPF